MLANLLMKFVSIHLLITFPSATLGLQTCGRTSSNRSQLRTRTVVHSTRSVPAQSLTQNRLQSFIRPLLPDLHRESIDEFDFGRVPEDDDFEILDYLPWYVLQDETKQCVNLIAKATRQYVYGDTRGDPKVAVEDVIQVIQDEYKTSDVPFRIGNCTYGGAELRHRQVAQILAFAAYHRLPSSIATVLFGSDDLEEYKRAFLAHGGWSGVVFPRGLAIRLPRNRLTKAFHRYQPIPRRFFHALNVKIAEKCVQEAARVQAPPRQLLSRQGFLDSLELELMKSSSKPWQLWGVSPFFPTKRNVFNGMKRRFMKLNAILRVVSERLKTYLRATMLSYGILAFACYNLSLIWQWQCLSATFRLSSSVFMSSLFRIGGVITHVFSDLHFVIPVLASALFLAPLTIRSMATIRERLGVANDNSALLCTACLLAISQVGVVTSMFLLDAAILRSFFLS